MNIKILAPVLWAAMTIWACSEKKDSGHVQSRVAGSVQAITNRNYQQAEIDTLQESFVTWSKLENMDTFVKKNPGKSFEFYYTQAEKIDNDPTASIDDGGEQTKKERILENIQHDIRAGKYTLQDIGTTSPELNARIKAEKRQMSIKLSIEKIDGDDGYDENNLPAYIQAIDNGLEPAEIPKRPSAPTEVKILKSEKTKKPETPSKAPGKPSAPTGLRVQGL